MKYLAPYYKNAPYYICTHPMVRILTGEIKHSVFTSTILFWLNYKDKYTNKEDHSKLKSQYLYCDDYHVWVDSSYDNDSFRKLFKELCLD